MCPGPDGHSQQILSDRRVGYVGLGLRITWLKQNCAMINDNAVGMGTTIFERPYLVRVSVLTRMEILQMMEIERGIAANRRTAAKVNHLYL